jgi:hypothetical protein
MLSKVGPSGYNVWRLVDLLVKLAIDGENKSYESRVDANQFLTVVNNSTVLTHPTDADLSRVRPPRERRRCSTPLYFVLLYPDIKMTR